MKNYSLFLILFSTNVFAKDNINTDIKFGFQSSSGNTESRALNASIKAQETDERFRNTGEFKISLAGEDGEEDKNQKKLKLQSDYKLKDKLYLYSNISLNTSEYSSYFIDVSLSPGVGYQWIKNEDFKLETELGVGYRYQEPNFDEIDDDDLILPENVSEPVGRFGLNFDWTFNEDIAFHWQTTITSGESNTRYENILALSSQINDRFTIQLEKEIDYLDRVPPGLENKDSEFNINFKYNLF